MSGPSHRRRLRSPRPSRPCSCGHGPAAACRQSAPAREPLRAEVRKQRSTASRTLQSRQVVRERVAADRVDDEHAGLARLILVTSDHVADPQRLGRHVEVVRALGDAGLDQPGTARSVRSDETEDNPRARTQPTQRGSITILSDDDLRALRGIVGELNRLDLGPRAPGKGDSDVGRLEEVLGAELARVARRAWRSAHR